VTGGHERDHAWAEALALRALAFLAEDPHRLGRFLGWTGLSPDGLRASLGEARVLGAILDYLADHEALLVAAAEAIGVAPEELARARARLRGPDAGEP
jgi:hypothetical protein